MERTRWLKSLMDDPSMEGSMAPAQDKLSLCTFLTCAFNGMVILLGYSLRQLTIIRAHFFKAALSILPTFQTMDGWPLYIVLIQGIPTPPRWSILEDLIKMRLHLETETFAPSHLSSKLPRPPRCSALEDSCTMHDSRKIPGAGASR